MEPEEDADIPAQEVAQRCVLTYSHYLLTWLRSKQPKVMNLMTFRGWGWVCMNTPHMQFVHYM